MGDHTGCGAPGVQRPHRIAGTAELERPAALQMLGLEGQLRPGQRIQRVRAQDRRDMGMRRDPRGGGQDIFGAGQQ